MSNLTPIRIVVFTLLAGVLFLPYKLSAQTKQETIAWINSKASRQFIFGDVFRASQKMKINADGSFVIISTDYEVPYDPFNPKTSCVTTLRGDFKNLSPNSVTLRQDGKFVFIEINCSNGSKCISIQSGKCGVGYDDSGISFGAFMNDEENIGPRLKNAFAHLINLCGGQKEAF